MEWKIVSRRKDAAGPGAGAGSDSGSGSGPRPGSGSESGPRPGLGLKSGASSELPDLALHFALEGTTEIPELNVGLTPGACSLGRTTLLYGPPGGRHSAIVGLGAADVLNAERLRHAAGAASRVVRREGYANAFVDLGVAANGLGLSEENCVEAWAEGWLLGSYVFDRYKKSPSPPALLSMTLAIGGSSEKERFAAIVRRASLRAESVMLARDWCNEPANVMTPEHLVEEIQRVFEDRPEIRVRIYRRGGELERLGLNGLLAVGQGSPQSPALVELTYASDPSQPLLALVGKGMTFDMGGMNMKTGRDLSEARFDMGGAAAVAGAMEALARGGVAANVVALIAVADNVPGPGALLPSSVIRYSNGLTVQVGNTDAEGRLILADALLHARRLGAAEIIDIATLTGSVGHALGLRVAGVWGDDGITEALRAIGEKCGDRVWPMPLVDDDEELLRSDYADLSNISSSPYGGAVAAGLFLRRFVGEGVGWAHIDMANTVQSPNDRGCETAGATGFGVRLLTDYVAARAGRLKESASK